RSRAYTGWGACHHASTGVTTNSLTGMNNWGSWATTVTLSGSTPASSLASRNAVAAGPESSGSSAPPGKATCPAWVRRLAARSTTSTSGLPSCSPSRIRTALRRPRPVGVGHRVKSEVTAVAARLRSGSHQSGSRLRAPASASRAPSTSALDTPARHPQVLLDQLSQLVLVLEGHLLVDVPELTGVVDQQGAGH